MPLNEILEMMSANKSCQILPPSDLDFKVRQGQVLPQDLLDFYTVCDGVRLFLHSDYPVEIVGRAGLIETNLAIYQKQYEDDLSKDWYIIAVDPDSQYLSIDFSLKRLGRCYDSFIGRHGIVGSCPVIATSFSDLLQKLFDNQGDYPYWLIPSFTSLGDAYDDVQ